ncbi:unnamed protein product [Effrenium voratum]|nr:unnamed protein product [Effrenium voratum]
MLACWRAGGRGLQQGVDTKNLPFLVHRRIGLDDRCRLQTSHFHFILPVAVTSSGNLPVYVEPTQKGEKFTRIRRVFGDAEHLAREVGRLCDSSARPSRGTRKGVEVLGVHARRIKEWLQHLGL